jgi:methylenetetrahydrofolate reductase (NADPH)
MRMESFAGDTASIQQLGEEIVTNLCAELLDMGAPGLHFYTMNLTGPTLNIWDNLGLSS